MLYGHSAKYWRDNSLKPSSDSLIGQNIVYTSVLDQEKGTFDSKPCPDLEQTCSIRVICCYL